MDLYIDPNQPERLIEEKPKKKRQFLPPGSAPLQSDFAPQAAIGTKFEEESDKITRALLAQGREGFDLAVHLDRGKLQKSLEIFKGISPDVAAKVQEIAEKGNAAFDHVFQSKDAWMRYDEARQIYNSLLEADDQGRLKYPRTANWIADPVHMMVARDSVEDLKTIEGLVTAYSSMPKYYMRRFAEGCKIGARNILASLQQIHEISGEIAEKTMDKKAIENAFMSFNPALWAIMKGEKELGEEGRAAVSQTFEAMREYPFMKRLQIPKVGGVKGFIGDWAENAPQIVQGLTMSYLTGSPAIGAGSMGLRIFGGTYQELIDKGVDKDRARIAALGHAVGESVLEYLPLSQWMEMFKATGTKDIFLDILRTSLSEFATEFFQEHVEEIATIWGEAEKEGQTPEEQFKLFMERLPETMKRGAYAGSLAIPSVLIGGSVKLPYNYVHAKYLESDSNFWTTLNDTIANSKLAQRSPKEIKTFIDKVADEVGARNTFFVPLDAVQTLFQDDAEAIDQFAKDLDIQEQLPEAAATGKELEIQVSKWAEKYGGTDLSTRLHDFIRFDPRGMTPAEYKKLNEDIKTELEDIQKNYMQYLKDNKLPSQYTEMRKTMMAPLDEGGFGLSAEDADAELKPFLAGATVLSRKGGETLEQWFKRVNPAITVGGKVITAPLIQYQKEKPYFRFSNFKTSRGDVPWLMFSESREEVEHYGKYEFIAYENKGNIINANDIKEEVKKLFDENPDILDEYQATSEGLASEVNPLHITDSAGIWDNPDLTQLIWDKILEPKGIQGIKTNDGLIIFDESLINKIEKQETPGAPRGSITFADGKTLINLYQKADMSTFVHESGHLFFNEMKKLIESGKADPQLENDFWTLVNFASKIAKGKKGITMPRKPALVAQPPKPATGMPMSDYAITSEMYDEIEKGVPPGKAFTPTAEEMGPGYTRVKGFASTYPNYFKNKGYGRNETLKALQKVLNNQKLGSRQQMIYDDLLESKKIELDQEMAAMGISPEDLVIEEAEAPTEEIEERPPEEGEEIDTSFEFGANIKTQYQGIPPSDDDIDFEKIAKAFEKYVMEGKAPSPELISSFRRLKNWLSAIYKALKTMDIEITDEVREVFDRLLAAEDDIKAAQEYYNIRKSIDEFIDLDEQEKQELAQRKSKAVESAIDKQIKKYMAAYKKAMDGGKKIKAQATEEISSMPVYKAITHAKERDGIGFDSLKYEFGISAVAQLSSQHKGLISKKGMIKIRDLAAEYGFESEAALFEAMLNAEDMKTAIQNRTKEIIQKTEAEIREDLMKQEEVAGEESIHTDRSLEYQIAQAEILAQKIEKGGKHIRRPRNLTAKAFKDAAESLLLDKPLKVATRYDIYAKSEQKYAKEVWDALKKGDYETAYAAWQKQILNHALVQASVRARKERQRIENGSKRLAKLKPERVEYENREAILALVHRYGLGTAAMVPQKPEEVNIPALIASMEDMGFPPAIPEWIQNMQGPDNYRDLTYRQIQELYAAMRNIYEMGRKDIRAKYISDLLKEFMNMEGDILIRDIADKLIIPMQKLKSRIPVDEHHWFSGPQKIGRTILSELNLSNITVQEMDAYQGIGPKGKTGPNEMVLMRPLAWADSEEKRIWDEQIKPNLEGKGDILQGLRKIFNRFRIDKQYGKSFRIDGVSIAENPDTFEKMKQHGMNLWTPERLILTCLNMGNTGNFRALQRGYGWSDEQVAKIQSMLTAEEWQTIQKIWDLVNEFYYPMDDVYFKINGSHIKKVAADPLNIITKDGQNITLKGGYFPLIFDQRLSDKAASNQEEDLMKNQYDAIFHNASTKSNFAYSRKGGQLPPKLNISVLYNHLHDVIHYITHAEVIRDIDRITKDPEWRNMINEKFGIDVYHEFREMLKYVARPSNRRGRGRIKQSIDRFATRYRKLATLYYLGFNLKSGLRQTTSLPWGAQEIGWNWTINGINQLLRHPEQMIADVNELSSYMKNQAKTMDREIQEQLKSIKPFVKKIEIKGKLIGLKEIQDFAFVFIKGFDKITRYAIWDGAYQKFMAENSKMKIEKRMIEAQSYADGIVGKTQPSVRLMDLAHWQRGEGLGRLLNMFMTPTLKYGHLTRAYFRGWKEGHISNRDYFRHIFNLQILPMAMTYAIVSSWAWLLGKDDDDEEKNILNEFFYEGINYSLSGYPVLRDLPGVLKYRYRDIVSIPALEPISTKHKRTFQKAWDLAFKDDPLGEKAKELLYAMALSIEFETGVPAIKVYGDLLKIYQAHLGEG